MEKQTVPGRKMKITRVSIVDQVCESIKQDIASGVWREGDKIPSESELAEMFGVNRLSVRMALQKLSTLGLIETRVGEGSFIRPFSLRPFLNEISLFYTGAEKYKEVQQLRLLLEGECIRIAVSSATPMQLDELKQALDHYFAQAAVYHGNIESEEYLERLVEADFNFHYKLVKMSRNQLFKDVYYMIQQIVRGHITKLVYLRTHEPAWSPPDQFDTHLKMYNSILAKDLEGAQRANREMLGIEPIPGLEDKAPLGG